MTGYPSIALKIPTKSSFCITFSLSSAATRSSRDSATTSRCITGRRSVAMNMCSVRQRPMPLAPNSRARLASSGVSALAQTSCPAASSAQPSSLLKSSEKVASVSGTCPASTRPEEPSTVTKSPFFRVLPRLVRVSDSRSIAISSQPQTAGLPMPRATTAAWLVMPPRLVTTAAAAKRPWMSSGQVSGRARMTDFP